MAIALHLIYGVSHPGAGNGKWEVECGVWGVGCGGRKINYSLISLYSLFLLHPP